jgi:vacuolar-type H+-ATPase subunit I/STV1
MKQWLKWLAECGLEFTRTDNGEDGIREYDFGHGIRVVKKESGRGSRGGMVEVNGFTTWHGSVQELVARIMEVLENAKAVEAAEAEVEAVEAEVQELVEQSEEIIAQAEVRAEQIILQTRIQETLQEMQRTLDNGEWIQLHERYLDYKMQLQKLGVGDFY